MKKVRTISLFSCCGGADYGLIGGFQYLDKYYKKHPVNIVHASDIDEKAVNTYNLNFTRKSIVEDVKSPATAKDKAYRIKKKLFVFKNQDLVFKEIF